MMKTKLYRVLIFLLLFTLQSCDNWLELLPPDGLVREEFWTSKDDVDAVLMGAYESFSGLNDLLFKFGEIRADMVVGDVNQQWGEQQIVEGNIFSDNGLCNWAPFYKTINYCNEVIKNAPEVKVKDNTMSDYLLNAYLAEAHFLRSLTYFYLVRIFKDVPYITKPTETDDVELYVPKTNGEAILNAIVVDLKAYRNFAPADGFYVIEENKGRASKAAFDALLADIALWNFNYEECLKHIANIEDSQKFSLLTGTNWFQLFYPGNSEESIFEIQFDKSKGQNNSLNVLTNYNSKQYDPSTNAIELFGFEFTRELVRGENLSIKKYGDGDFIIWKYVGSQGDGNTTRPNSESSGANWIVYRLADIILMKAEALSQLERFDEALTELNRIRMRADVDIFEIANSRIAFEDAIMKERALELAFEGKRWFDLLRMARRDNYNRKDKLIEILVLNIPSSQKRLMKLKLTDPLGWYMPIFNEELERNKALVQNPYYK